MSIYLPIMPGYIKATRIIDQKGNRINGLPKKPSYPRCAFCDTTLNPSNRTDDHLFSRAMLNMVPGSRGLNYQIKVCKSCNNAKSLLEGPFSALCMIPGPTESDPVERDRKMKEFVRQANGTSWNGVPLVDCIEIKAPSAIIMPGTMDNHATVTLKGFTINDFHDLFIWHVQGLYTVRFNAYLDPSRIDIVCCQNIHFLEGGSNFMRPFVAFGPANDVFNIGMGSVLNFWWDTSVPTCHWLSLVYQTNTTITAIIQ